MTRMQPWCSACRCVVALNEGGDRHREHAKSVVTVPEMWALTLHDPWLWAIDSLPPGRAKDVENRSWPPYPWIRRSRWLALHVGQEFEDERRDRIGQLGGVVPPTRNTAEMRERRGRITCVVRIDGALEPSQLSTTPRGPRPWHFPDHWGWEIGALHKLGTPVTADGKQKVWRVPVAAAAEVARQLPAEVINRLAQPAQG